MKDDDLMFLFHFMQPCMKRIWVTRFRKEDQLWDILESLGYNCVQKPVWRETRNHCMLVTNFFLKGCRGSCAYIYGLMYSNSAMTLASPEDVMKSSNRHRTAG